MTDARQGAQLPAAPTPALDLTGYVEVMIYKTGEIDGHPYRRGTRHTVDAGTLAALRGEGLVPPDLDAVAASASAVAEAP